MVADFEGTENDEEGAESTRLDAEAELDEGPADDSDGEGADELETVFGEAEGEVIE